MKKTMLELSSLPYSEQPGFSKTYQTNRLTLGLFYPIEAYSGDAPSMEGHVGIAEFAEQAGFAALWVRDVPLRDPNFGDLGQIFDPWVYLGYLAAKTTTIALGTGAIVVPIRHPLHLAKAAASVDQISNGRLLLGVASGDRPVEFPAFGIDAMDRSSLFKEYVQVLKMAQTTSFEPIQFKGGSLFGADVVPKPFSKEIPLFITGNSQQSMEWIAENGHGWITYPRPPEQQKLIIERWNKAVKDQSGELFKPFTQSLYIDLLKDPNAPLTLIHLGYRGGRNNLIRLLNSYEEIGVNHVMLSLKYSGRPALEVVEELGEFVLPNFPTILKT